MNQPLPTGNSKWVHNVDAFDVRSIVADSPTGYILDVDLGMYFHHINRFGCKVLDFLSPSVSNIC